MSRIGTVVSLLRVYFWVLLLAILLGGAYLVNEYIIQSGAIASGYYAIGGFAGLIVLLFLAFKRFIQ